MHEVKALIRPDRLYDVVQALHELPDMPGITTSTVQGFGRRNDHRKPEAMFGETTMTKIETVVTDELVDRVVELIQRAAGTGRPGDGKIFVIPVGRAIRIRSGDAGEGVL
jgi:nitrogen regulatory protein P-II 1